MLFQRQKNLQNYLTDQTYVSGVLTGLVVGLAAGFLFAPRSGKELRKKIAGSVSDQTEEVKHQWNKTKAQAKDTFDAIKTNASTVANNVGNEFNTYADQAGHEIAKETDHLADQAKSAMNRF